MDCALEVSLEKWVCTGRILMEEALTVVGLKNAEKALFGGVFPVLLEEKVDQVGGSMALLLLLNSTEAGFALNIFIQRAGSGLGGEVGLNGWFFSICS